MTDSHNHEHNHENPVESSEKKFSTGAHDDVESEFLVSGVDCTDEVEAIQNAMKEISVTSVQVNIMASKVVVKHSASLSVETITSAIEKTGVKVVEKAEESFTKSNKKRLLLIAASGVFLGFGFLSLWSGFSSLVEILLFSLATIASGILVFPKAFRALKQKSLDMNLLMSVAVVGAFAIKEYSEAATVVFLFSVAELLEAFSVDRARKAIKEVLKITPQLALRKTSAGTESVPVKEIRVGEFLVVKPGDSFPLDGIVKEGRSSVNQAPVTGESKLVKKEVGDTVFAGTINENGVLVIEVTKAFEDTKISRMMKLIEEAQSQKSPSERFVDKFAKIYTPIVFIVAILVSIVPPLFFQQEFSVWFYRALVLLVVACPCALVLATPISVVSGLASLAKRGVLVKGGVHLESLGKLKVIAVDKTGTLTEGKFKVQSFIALNNQDGKQALTIAASLDALSSHPLAKAVVDYAKTQGINPKQVSQSKAVPGRGAQGYVDSHLYFVGNHQFAHELGVCTPELEALLSAYEDKALSVVVIGHAPHDGHDGVVMGIMALGDAIRSNAQIAISALHSVGIQKVVMLSGDHQKTVSAVQKLTGVDEAYGSLLPEDKVQKMKELRTKYSEVAMVGDGINDAPALAHASIGISMGAAGTDAAIETSDVALMQDNLEELAKAVSQGRRVLRVIRFNIGFALATKIVFLGLSMVGISNLWLAVAADMGASIFVTLNALRLLRI